MEASRYLQCLAADYGDLRDAASAAELTANVPSCPGWTVADLVRHVAEVYLHKVTLMRTGEEPEEWPPPSLAAEAPLAALGRAYLVRPRPDGGLLDPQDGTGDGDPPDRRRAGGRPARHPGARRSRGRRRRRGAQADARLRLGHLAGGLRRDRGRSPGRAGRDHGRRGPGGLDGPPVAARGGGRRPGRERAALVVGPGRRRRDPDSRRRRVGRLPAPPARRSHPVGNQPKKAAGTHVASTRQVGRIEVVKIESKGKGFRRLRIRRRVPGRPQEVLAWIRAHLPPGFTPAGAGVGTRSGSEWWTRVFALPAVPDVLTQRELVVLAVRSGSQSAIRVDAQVVWLPARPVAERAPPAARVLTVTPVFGFNPAPRARRLDRAFTVTDPATVARIAAVVNGLTRFPGGAFSCPAESGGQM